MPVFCQLAFFFVFKYNILYKCQDSWNIQIRGYMVNTQDGVKGNGWIRKYWCTMTKKEKLSVKRRNIVSMDVVKPGGRNLRRWDGGRQRRPLILKGRAWDETQEDNSTGRKKRHEGMEVTVEFQLGEDNKERVSILIECAVYPGGSGFGWRWTSTN